MSMKSKLLALAAMGAMFSSMPMDQKQTRVDEILKPDNKPPISHKSGLTYRKKKRIEGRHPKIEYVKGGIIKDGLFIPKEQLNG